MYTNATINKNKTKRIQSAKRIYLKHKEKTDHIPIATSQTDTSDVTAHIYFTNLPLDGKKSQHIDMTHAIAVNATTALFTEKAVSDINIATKVREKDQTIVSQITFDVPACSEEEIQAKEKEIWYPLKMETLKELITHPAIGDYVPLTDGQVEQLGEYTGLASSTQP